MKQTNLVIKFIRWLLLNVKWIMLGILLLNLFAFGYWRKMNERGLCDEETFWDIIEECRKYKNLKPKVLASHSNCKAICNARRNLTDDQIRAIKEFNGIIGIVSIKTFCSSNKHYEQAYIENITHIKNLLGEVDNIGLATDDMTYYKIDRRYYKKLNLFKQSNINEKITKLLLKNNYTNDEINKLKIENYSRFWNLK